MRSLVATLALIASLAPGARAQTNDEESSQLRKSIVTVLVTRRPPDLGRPWTKQPPIEVTGTGVVIPGHRVLTNQHVVSYASRILVQPDGSSDKLVASVAAAKPGIDLASLQLEDESFFDKHPPIAISEALPTPGEAVSVYGYPVGGETLSITKGVVSRIEYVTYYFMRGLRMQIDAALNPGNSGGPAVMQGKCVGIVASSFPSAEKVGYVIPAEEIRAFLAAAARGDLRYRPRLDPMEQQGLENDALRASAKVPQGASGLLVRRMVVDKPDDPLRKWDVIAAIGDHELDNSGMVQVQPNLRLAFDYFLPGLARDGRVPLTILRDGQKTPVEVPVRYGSDLLVKPLDGAYPSYVILGPLAFTVAYAEHLIALKPNLDALVLRHSPLVERAVAPVRFEDEQLVLGPSKLFPHRIAKGYNLPPFAVLARVNGTEVKNLRHLIELVRTSQGPYLTFEWDDANAETIVFARDEFMKSTEEVLADNDIREAASDDMKGASGGP